MLSLEAVTCAYGPATVVHDVDLQVAGGEVVALIGPNGAGKTSTIQCIAGHVRARSGRVRLGAEDITTLSPQQRVARGVAVSPEGRRLFADMTVRENLIVGGLSRPRSATRPNLERVLALFPRLLERLDALAGTLSGGEQQMTAIGRAMMAEPKLLMIDEVSLGLTPKNVDICYEAITRLKGRGVALLLVEQNLPRALQAADRVYVLESGRLQWSGSATEARSNRGLLERILGQSGEDHANPLVVAS
jgi:branched-chain amino acid transport system ATP-binding protein